MCGVCYSCLQMHLVNLVLAGDFLDRARRCKIDAQSFLDFQALAPIMAASYEDPSSAATQDTMAALGCNPIGMIGMPGGGEAARARNFRNWLKGVIARVSPASSAPCNLERIEIGVSKTHVWV